MKQTATVCEIKKDTAIVEVQRRSACAGCHAGGCLGCGKAVRAEAENAIGARVGDTVELEATTTHVLLHAVLVFLMPLVLAVGMYLLGWGIALPEPICYLLALGGLVLAFAGLMLYARMRGVEAPLRIVRVLGTERLDESENEKW